MNSSTFPADFILVAAMNACPSSYRSDPRRACSCTPPQVERYLGKISGPLLDRIDLYVEVPAVPFTQLAELRLALLPANSARRCWRCARQSQRLNRKSPLVRAG
jgi:magnesium chelatase family protein